MKKITRRSFLKVAGISAAAMGLAACGSSSSTASTATASSAAASTASSAAAATGKVYYLNFKPESDQAWQDLAKKYTESTGVEVKVVTAASGSYSETLTAEMDKTDMPTLFQCGNKAGLDTWGDYCYDLSDTDVYKEMTTDDFNLTDASGAVKAIGYCYEAFGIITNLALLEKAGYKKEDITNFDSLQKVAEDITKRHASGELDFAAFTSSGLDDSSSWRFSGHLANMPLYYEFRDDNVTEQPATIKGTYMDNYKKIWDLYVANSDTKPAALTTATGDQAEAEFGQGKACFYQNGTWEYSNLVTDATKNFKMDATKLAMLPIYCGVSGEEKAGLCCGTENCWAVNAKSSEDDRQATLDFIDWVVTSDEGTQMMAEQFGPIPFKSAKASENVFFNDANAYINAGNYTVTWAFNYTPNVDEWRKGVVAALTQYTVGSGKWDDVVSAFVQGWATQYNNQ
jgi:raffinose/stachyose/melibiose transport system substrate-binding protein